MKTIIPLIRPLVLTLLALTSFVATTLAQEVSIPDPGLNAAIREALQKPFGPLTEQDLLSLTNLNASRRNVKSIVGLEAARNLVSLDLQINRLTNFSLPSELTKLSTLDVSVNPLTNFFLPSGLTNLTSLTLESDGFTNLTLPAGLTGLRSLDLENNQLTSFNLLSNLTSLVSLDLGFNSFTNFSLPGGLTNLATFYFAGNPLTNVVLPPGLAGMTELNLSQNLLTSFTLPAGMTNLIELDLFFNQLTNLTLPADLRNLIELDLDFNQFTQSQFPFEPGPPGLSSPPRQPIHQLQPARGVDRVDLSRPQQESTHEHHAAGGSKSFDHSALSGNQLTSLTLPVGLTNLTALNLSENQLTNLVLPPDLNRLESLDLGGNQLTSLNLPAGLTNLIGLFFVEQSTDQPHVASGHDPVGRSWLSWQSAHDLRFVRTLAATNLAADVATLQSQGVSVFTYPLTVQLVRLRQPIGAFQFASPGRPEFTRSLAPPNLTPGARWAP